MKFEIITGPVEYGWCDFSVRVGGNVWSCQASYVGEYPLDPLLHSAVNLHNHLFIDPIPEENAVCESRILDEPGGILIEARPEEGAVAVRVFHDPGNNELNQIADDSLVATLELDYWEYASAIANDARRAVARQGFVGLRNGWEGPEHWGFDFEYGIFPVEQFLYLLHLVRDRQPPVNRCLSDEILLLQQVANEREA